MTHNHRADDSQLHLHVLMLSILKSFIGLQLSKLHSDRAVAMLSNQSFVSMINLCRYMICLAIYESTRKQPMNNAAMRWRHSSWDAWSMKGFRKTFLKSGQDFHCNNCPPKQGSTTWQTMTNSFGAAYQVSNFGSAPLSLRITGQGQTLVARYEVLSIQNALF